MSLTSRSLFLGQERCLKSERVLSAPEGKSGESVPRANQNFYIMSNLDSLGLSVKGGTLNRPIGTMILKSEMVLSDFLKRICGKSASGIAAPNG